MDEREERVERRRFAAAPGQQQLGGILRAIWNGSFYALASVGTLVERSSRSSAVTSVKP